MPSGNSNYTSLITTTLQNHSEQIFDAVTTNNAAAYMLKKKGNIKISKGGRTFTHPIMYGTNASFQAYNRMEQISLPETDIITRAEYNIKTLAGSIVLPTLDMAMNAGDKTKLLDLADEKRQEAEISMGQLLGAQVFADGTTNTKGFGGFQFLISDTPSTQTDVGGIDASATGNTYWRNYVNTASIATFGTSQAGISAMNVALNNTTFGTLGPKAIFTTKAVFNLYELALQSNVRYTNQTMADAGFRNLEFKTMPIMFDDNCPAAHMYFVDMDSLWLQVLADGNMRTTNFQQKQDQLLTSALMYMFGNLTTGSRRTNGVLTNITG